MRLLGDTTTEDYMMGMDNNASLYRPTPRQERTGEVCPVCAYRCPPKGRSVCEVCIPVSTFEQERTAALAAAQDEAARLRAALELIAQVRHVSGSAQAAFRSNLRVADAALAGKDMRDIETVIAVAEGG